MKNLPSKGRSLCVRQCSLYSASYFCCILYFPGFNRWASGFKISMHKLFQHLGQVQCSRFSISLQSPSNALSIFLLLLSIYFMYASCSYFVLLVPNLCFWQHAIYVNFVPRRLYRNVLCNRRNVNLECFSLFFPGAKGKLEISAVTY